MFRLELSGTTVAFRPVSFDIDSHQKRVAAKFGEKLGIRGKGGPDGTAMVWQKIVGTIEDRYELQFN